MKTIIKRLTVPLLCLIVTNFFISCQDDDSQNQPAEQNVQFEESKIISFDAIEEMTQNIIDGELAVEESEASGSENQNKVFGFNISREKRIYDFSGTVNSGAGSGTELSGELKLNFTFYHASFTIVRGVLELPDGAIARTRGAIISDGFVYLIINPPGRDLIFGIGRIGDDGNLQGGFRLFTNGGVGRGSWTATLTEATFPNKTIVELAVEDGRFTTLVGALQAADLVGALNGEGPFTVFAPTDDAFAALETIPEGETLKEILLYHVASGRLNTSSLLEQELIETLQGENVKVSLNSENEIVINDTVKLLSANIGGSNGVIQVIDAVLIPPSFRPLQSIVDTAIATPELSTLVSALQAADLVGALSGEGPFTVFAPTNTAFEALEAIPEGDALKEVLLYHVASGKFTAADLLEKQTVTTLQGAEVTIEKDEEGNVLLNGSIKVMTADIEATNGIIHLITGVLLPPAEIQSIVDTAIATPELSTLVGALQAADLVGALSGEGPFTVFAPTNTAFEALEAIPEGDALKEVLLYHVASGKFTAADLLEKQTVTTLQGAEVTIEKDEEENVLLNGSIKVMTADIEATNGIIHVITGVLLPPMAQNIVDIAVATPELSTLVGALQSAELVDALNGEGPFTVFAPTNAAFEALETIPSGEALKQVLLYHVVSGKFTAQELLREHTVTTLQGDRVTIQRNFRGQVILNRRIKVELADIEASNGIVHVIKNVLIPPRH
ncbi:fasciclin domain-containing protein [Aquimarina algicola]|uniref:Fasciclin domain-containing protein n=1 Tax=Aquimarina algicola TaxID=2589995 RepID=A0A504IYQ0_9FLAO|nr:fasciclin domain-containing protein [Aquimarina algicola]TPN81272.1 fasciclin domain-containing protein [Aquimarina algicola]